MTNKFIFDAPIRGNANDNAIVVDEEEEQQDSVQLYEVEHDIYEHFIEVKVFPDLPLDEHTPNDLVGNIKLIYIISFLDQFDITIQYCTDRVIYNCFHSSIDNKEEMLRIVRSYIAQNPEVTIDIMNEFSKYKTIKSNQWIFNLLDCFDSY